MAAFSCPSCGKTFGPDYQDTFCPCGIELVRALGPERPPPGTPCLVLYGPDAKPQRYFPLTRDVAVVGRLDAVGGHFPEIDLSAVLEPDLVRRISRAHVLILRLRAKNQYFVRPLEGNTGTQIEADMVLPGQDYLLQPGTRLVLGGSVRLKFEIV